jgi:hypothetical protein
MDNDDILTMGASGMNLYLGAANVNVLESVKIFSLFGIFPVIDLMADINLALKFTVSVHDFKIL